MKQILKLENYLFNILLIWLAILIYNSFRYYKNFLRPDTQLILLTLAITYTVLGFTYHITSKKQIPDSKGKLFFTGLTKLSKMNKQEKNAILFTLVKFFFLPIMLNFFLNNFYSIKYQISNLTTQSFLSISNFNNILFPFLLALIFLIDTLWFAFGYAFESKKLNNQLRSVEPTFFGWAVALICYPPFNSFATNGINLFGFTLGLNWYANDYAIFFNDMTTFILRIIIILLLGIYVSATLALGTKCSNLTNRGIVSRGPYALVRHPAYISKNLAWWLTIIPVASLPAFLSMSAWSFIYHMRTLTEERHLSKDIDYKIYKNKVKWKYVPGVY